ncbi:hypothetical protein PF005_g31753 [Phytophthora fragariae]|uniref:Uncharacterized protein n=1 Tax=Phytophthora fragariae TaxID=53985 RepID=A0A6A3DE55_9STRA|nr:hypothetical protein PF003_g34518 [Phytophthora fragariae]KAE8917897.1 hypothetical protein PF009_g31785 [Phytophthora fragariae]KAE9058278.1 hypothetical protein PF007_g31361 [Phytophthora fragariae]KAE9058303.1 hypothetical protein PF010_g31051 [Phytophthora fragariae]KAE9060211.1 hypothetical protein PF006_g31702 [Phytophthora fragariae]
MRCLLYSTTACACESSVTCIAGDSRSPCRVVQPNAGGHHRGVPHRRRSLRAAAAMQ